MIKTLTPQHKTALINLLKAANLPTSDINFEHQKFLGAFTHGNLAGAAGLEYYADYALLRSVVVSQRLAGLGAQLVEHAQKQAMSDNKQSIFLLTETAAPFFSKLNFEKIDRGQMPLSIQNSRQFSEICPQSAVCMMKSLIR